MDYKLGFSGKIVKQFLTTRMSIVVMIASLFAGAVALLVTPREEDPQIVVPFADVIINCPGASPEEIERQVIFRLEKKLWEIDGVKHIYSMAKKDSAIVTMRFFVGEDREDSLVKMYNKLWSNVDDVPDIVKGWIIKPIEIEDVSIVNLTLYSKRYDDYTLRRVSDEILNNLQEITSTSKSKIIGGRKRQIKVEIDKELLKARNLSMLGIVQKLKSANINLTSGTFDRYDKEYFVQTGDFLKSAGDVKNLVVGVSENKPIYLNDIAHVEDGYEESNSYTWIGFGPALRLKGIEKDYNPGEEYPSVTIAIAKKKGTNAVWTADEIIKKVEELKKTIIPSDVEVLVTRNYGETANEKVNELVKHLFIAIASIIVLLAFFLGWKESIIVALAVPLTLAVTLFCDLVFGYTINRVTLFALILSLGLLVDDPIVDVENIHRHFKLRKEPPMKATLHAVMEVRPPTILATFTVIVSFLPLLFISGMMGPYMGPMPFNVPIAMLLSLFIAFTVTPWATYHMLKGEYKHKHKTENEELDESAGIKKVYRKIITPLLESRKKGYLFLLILFIGLIISGLLAITRLVPLKMLPFDNKNELQLVVDMPEGITLERTNQVVKELGNYLATVEEVTDYESYVGLASPFDFNGMVRHYFLRQGSNVADIRINLADKHYRKQKSHAIALRIRPEIEKISKEQGANIKIVESPPGPPVLATIVAEIYGPLDAPYNELINVSKDVREVFENTPFVVDVDDYSEDDQVEYRIEVDKEKAGLHGISTEQISKTLAIALSGIPVSYAHVSREREPLEIFMKLPKNESSSIPELIDIYVQNSNGNLVPVRELVKVDKSSRAKTIYRKDLKRVCFVTGDSAGQSPVEAILSMQKHFKNNPLPVGYEIKWAGEGEWNITVDVFRDLGIAFGVALIGIYILLMYHVGSMLMPLIIMTAIPLTAIGIMPGFYFLNLFFASNVGEYPNPIFFTATGMIGMIALAGIVVRNSIILIDFIQLQCIKHKIDLEEAIIEAGAIRFRPILLTAGAAMFGSLVITLDPIFSGLAWSFIFGIFASTLFTLIVVPLIFYMVYSKDWDKKMKEWTVDPIESEI